ncbi:LITAF-like zinc ribbon domain-containing protein, partial [Auriculariales sp. MPI-PUGE-AT-0066]
LNNLVSYAGACICPNCGQNQITRVTYQAGGYAHIWAIVFGVFLLSCCIPFLVNSFKDVLHTCSSCGVPLAVYHRSGKTVVLAQPA